MDHHRLSLGSLGLGGGGGGGGGGVTLTEAAAAVGLVGSVQPDVSASSDKVPAPDDDINRAAWAAHAAWAPAPEARQAAREREGTTARSREGSASAQRQREEEEEEEDAPRLVHRSERTAVYRWRDAGVKVALGRDGDPRAVDAGHRRILHERNVSNYLPHNCRRRLVTNATTYEGRPALAFRWASGVTLRQWLQSVRMGGNRAEIGVRLRAAMAIAKTLRDFHDGGAAYRRLTPENVVLAPCEGEYAATFIDLSGAVIFGGGEDDGGESSDEGERTLRDADLECLGSCLDQIFRGEETPAAADPGDGPAGGGGDRRGKKGRRGRGAAVDSSGEGIPLYLGTLTSALLDASDASEPRYDDAGQVWLDLKTFAEAVAANPRCDLGRCGPDDSSLRGRLLLRGGAFYGRQVQMSMLMSLFQSSAVLGDRPLMATISGYPGTGKSTLVNQIKKPLLDMNGYFVEEKFSKSARPDVVLASALDSFFGRVLDSDGARSALVSMKWRVHDAVGASGSDDALFEIVPNLRRWMFEGADPAAGWMFEGGGAAGSACGGAAAAAGNGPSAKIIMSSHRLKFMLCKLVGAIPCKAHPLILFMDDLQWADEMTLDIIRMIMTDPDIRHFLFLGCYRDNEVNITHPLTAKLQAIQDQGISIVNIKIGPIEKESVNKLLSEALCMPPSLCQPLSNVVHGKTGGIILFVLRFLASLKDDGDFWFSMRSCRWMYNLEEIRLKEIHGDVVSHMTEHMKSLPKKIQMGLKFAACLGPKFDARVLEKAEKCTGSEDSILKSCVEFGFLQNAGADRYVWAHDEIQQAAYDLIPLPKRESFHLLVGSRLFMSTLPAEMDHMIFFVVENMNRGTRLIDDPDLKYEVSQLNLQAGEKAVAASAFHSAAEYLSRGISLLGPESWAIKYDLTIRLYDAASEALVVTGDFPRLSELIDEPLTNARSFEDKLNILNNFVRALSASSKFEKGIAKCMSILSQLGEWFPAEVTADVYTEELAQVKQVLRGKTRQDFLSLPKMSDTRKLAAMQFMNHALLMGFNTQPKLNIVIVFRMVRMSIEHGMCNVSAFAFACYGTLLVNVPFSDVEGGHSMGRVACEMTEKLGAVEMIPRLYASVYGFINIWKEPWQAGLSKHLEAYESGSKTGDIEYATINLYQYVNKATFGCGENLESLSKNIQLYAKRAFQCNQHNGWKIMAVLHQLTLDLMGEKQNAFSACSISMTEDSCFEATRDNHETTLCRLFAYKKKFVAFFTGQLVEAANMYELCQEYPIESGGRLVSALVNVFIDGLIGFFFARKHQADEAKWTTLGTDAIRSLREWVGNSAWNFSNKLYLLEAEHYFLKEDDEKALLCYDASIKAAREHRFVHEEGLAEEKLATYLLNKNRHEEGMEHFVGAKKCYEAWGARSLVRRVNNVIGILLPVCKGT